MNTKLLIGILFLSFSIQTIAQVRYEKMSEGAVNRIFKKFTEEFAHELMDKCAKKDYSSEFKSAKLSIPMDRYLAKNLEKICTENEKKYGTIEIVKFNNAYYHKYMQDDQVQMFVYNIQSNQSNDAKYLSIWVGAISKKIQGFWITKNKPLEENLVIHY
ncbi:MAG: hypothetical protein JSS94_00715 [Bacteroidetes bacterium]|nr:hypothetical protein [Bacteroidota bacterium]